MRNFVFQLIRDSSDGFLQFTYSLSERSACFYVRISGNFERFQYLNFEAYFLENENLSQKSWKLKVLRLKTHHCHTKLPNQKPMFRQIVWWVQNGPITNNGVLPVTTFFFKKFCFSLGTSYKELIWCTNDPNADIPTFCKWWTFIWRSFFPVSIINWAYLLAEMDQNLWISKMVWRYPGVSYFVLYFLLS